MRVPIVIVNYRTAGLVVDCLRSLAAEHGQPFDLAVTVVDNASPDDSVAVLREAVDSHGWSWASILPLDRNGGFAFGNNAALRPLLADGDDPFVLLLNPDTVVRPGFLGPMVARMQADSRAGIVGSRLEDPDGTPQRSAFRFPSVLGELEEGLRLGIVSRLLARYTVAPPTRDDAHVTDWVAGASMLVRREVFETAGLFDEGYFLYFEEVDFCRRARKAGWRTWYEPASRVVHLVGQASGVTDTKRPARRMPRYWFDSRRRYFDTHLRGPAAWLADAAHAGGYALWRARRPLQRKPDTDPPGFLADFVRFNFLERGARP